MAKKYVISINNGTGSQAITNGSYSVTASSTGYDASTIDPNNIVINSETGTYDFTIGATGTLNLHVTEDGTTGGTPIVGATFYRCDKDGVTYGNIITTDSQGIATFNNVPYAADGAPKIYYKQISSDDTHDFDSTLKDTTLTAQTGTVEVQNPTAVSKTITLKDANYNGLPIELGEITLEE